jgi:alanyl-tRNA synthetase
MKDIVHNYSLGLNLEQRINLATREELEAALQAINDDLEWCQTLLKLKSTPNYKNMVAEILTQKKIVEKELSRVCSKEDFAGILKNISIVNQYRY